ncbi:hypothetical protein V2J09_018308 [Rumex salicifolius]
MTTKQAEILESRPLSTISISAIRKFLPRSMSSSKQQLKTSPLSKSRHFVDDENAPPLDPNIEVVDFRDSLPIPKKSPSKPLNSLQQTVSVQTEKSSVTPASPDPAVKVVARIRPPNAHEKGGDWTVRKLSKDTLIVEDRSFSFDSVLDSKAKQEDVFELVGAPLVTDALAGYNATVLSYGQSGSGKTYTLWGPPSAMVEGHSPSTQQGIGPRIFKMLFSEIETIKQNSNGKQINYQCRCSFLEIHNGQLGDLLDPTQRNLQIKDDSKTGFYIENMTEAYVTSYDDVTQILIKGLSNRKVGATSMNSKSSHSHVVLTCVIESWCKETSSHSFSSSKTSRICLVDLAGQNKNKLDDTGRELERQGKHVKKSLSKLGHLVSILAEGKQPDDKVYMNSFLTHLLQESLGGNAKLSVICNISPSYGNMGETLSTVRFAQQVRCVKNFPVINEITEDDVNDLSDQIRQLKEELLKAKLDSENPSRTSHAALFRGNVRESVNRLRLSLNRSLILPPIENDPEEEASANEVDVEALCRDLDELHKSCDELPCISESMNFASARGSCDTYFTTDHDDINCSHDSENEDVSSFEAGNVLINSSHQSSVLEDPPLSESPKISNLLRKSTSPSILSRNQKEASIYISKSDFAVPGESVRQSEKVSSSLRSSRILSCGPTESLAASLKRGLEIIDYHQRNSVSSRSPVAFSFEHLMLKPSPAADNVNASVQTISSGQQPVGRILCKACQRKVHDDSDEVDNSTDIVEVASTTREKELEKVCHERGAKIEELTKLVEKLKHEETNYSVPREDLEIIDKDLEVIKEACEIEEFASNDRSTSFDMREKEELLTEIQTLKSKLNAYTNPPPNKSIDRLRSSLLSRSFQLRKSMCAGESSAEELEKERERWTEMESEWINLTDELRIDLECNRQRAEKAEMELNKEKKWGEEIDDALHRAMLGHARMVEHYVELQEKYDDLAEKHRRVAEYISDVKRAAEKAGAKGKKGSHFAKALANELSSTRMEKEKERERLKKENKSLKIQLRDTAEAVQTAGELLVRLREAEQAASVAEGALNEVQLDNEKLRRQVDKVKRKHKMEMDTMKTYMAESKLPQSALNQMHFDESEIRPFEEEIIEQEDDDQAWRAEFGAIYQDQDRLY